MSADVLLDIDPLVIEELDAPIPCEGTFHASGRWGHDPAAPAAFLQVMTLCTCPDRAIYKCDGNRRWLLTEPVIDCSTCGMEMAPHELQFIPIDGVSS